jgi:hypothetical protein
MRPYLYKLALSRLRLVLALAHDKHYGLLRGGHPTPNSVAEVERL